MATTQLVTAEQFVAMPDVPGAQLELVRGEIVQVPTPAYTHMLFVMAFIRLLDPFVRSQRLGKVFTDGLGYVVARDPDTVYVPDVSFIAQEHIPAEGFGVIVPFAPDLAMEIASPSNTRKEMREKAHDYLMGGARLVWVVSPADRTITVHASEGDTPRALGLNDELDGGEVLPGFRVRVGDLFADAH